MICGLVEGGKACWRRGVSVRCPALRSDRDRCFRRLERLEVLDADRRLWWGERLRRERERREW